MRLRLIATVAAATALVAACGSDNKGWSTATRAAGSTVGAKCLIDGARRDDSERDDGGVHRLGRRHDPTLTPTRDNGYVA